MFHKFKEALSLFQGGVDICICVGLLPPRAPFGFVLCLFCESRRRQRLLPSTESLARLGSFITDIIIIIAGTLRATPLAATVNTTINMEYNNNDKVSQDPRAGLADACCLFGLGGRVTRDFLLACQALNLMFPLSLGTFSELFSHM